MIIRCPKCGNLVSDKATVCPSCGASLSPSQESAPKESASQESAPKESTPQEQKEAKEEPVRQQEPEEMRPIPEKPSGEGWYQEPEKKKTGGPNLIILSAVLSVVILGLGGFFLYNNVIKPRKIDKAAPRYYTFVPSVVLRSSRNSGADYNKIGSLPYGTELITYDYRYDWSEVKVNSVNGEGKPLKGYIASPYILDKKDFFLLNSIFGDVDSKIIIETAKCRRALLDYYKSQQYIGRMSSEEASELGLPLPSYGNQWQVYCLPKGSYTNNVYFKRILRKDSKFTDFAVIIKNINSGERKLLYFGFEDDETPRLAVEQPAPEYGTIRKIGLKTKGGDRYIMVEYTE